MSEKDLQEYLSKEFQGEDSFLENIIFPIFDESNYQTAYRLPVLEGDDSLKALAARCGIQEVILYGTVSIGHIIIQIFEVTVQDHVQMSRNRVTIQQIIRRIMETYSSAFIIFHYEDNWQLDWRFSYCQKDAKDMTEAKRYTFLLGPNQSCRTAAQNFMKLMGKGSSIQREEIEDAFSVEALSKEFFGRYKEIYENIILYVTGKKMVKVGNKWEEQEKGVPCDEIMQEFSSFKDPEKAVRDYVKKLMGRLVFLQFLQKKGWLGVPADEGWGKGKHDFMQDLYERTEDKLNFIDNVLEVLFNDLNTERDNDIASQTVGSNIRIPYLNGGLFERDEADEKRFPLPPEHLDNLFKFFSWYNFTIDENDPDDAEMSVDPEMLGRIFENLLEDNKDKGAFYTPKEIVSYMCRESLISYLQTDIEDETAKVAIREFVTTHRKNDKLPSDINQKLRDVKICDPAIGSGAFPMGLLKELFLCRTSIEDNEHINAAEIKKHIIQNNIYGVDLERGAVDIARLRFWLSLIVDEESPRALPNLDYKIVEGNSLITTFDGQYIDLTTDVGLLRSRWSSNKIKTEKAALKEEQNRFFNLNGEEKYKSVIKIKKHILNCIGYQLEYEKISWENAAKEQPSLFGGNVKSKKDKRPHVIFTPERQKILDKCYKLIDILSDDSRSLQERAGLSVPFFEWETVFSDIFESQSNKGFDIVIGNPPYIQLEAEKGKLSKLYSPCGYKTFVSNGNIYCLFFERGWQLLRSKGILCYITLNKWMRAKYGENLRSFITTETCPLLLVDFGGVQVFENANADTEILLFQRVNNIHRIVSAKMKMSDKIYSSNLTRFVENNSVNCDFKGSATWVVRNEYDQKLKERIESQGTPLGLWNIVTNRGILTGCNDAFIISEDIRNQILDSCMDVVERQKTNDLIVPIIRGKDVRKYGHNWENARKYLINSHNGVKNFMSRIDIEEYPTVKRYLDSYIKKLIKRSDKGDTPYNLRNCAFLNDFSKPKIIFPNMTKYLPFYFDNKQFFTNQKCFIVSGKHLSYLTAFLNSSLFKFCFMDDFPTLGEDRRELSKIYFNKIPVRIVSDQVDRDFNKLVLDIQDVYTEEKAKEIDRLIFDIYELSQSERDRIGFIDFHNVIDEEDDEED